MGGMTVVVADGVRPVVRRWLSNLRDVEVVGESWGAALTEALVGVTKPDLILVDVQASGLHGVSTARQIRDRVPEVRVLVLGEAESPEMVQQVGRSGVFGHVLDMTGPQELLEVLRAAVRARRLGVLDLTDGTGPR